MNSKIIVFVTMAAGLLVALFLGMAVGEGRQMHIAAVFAFMIGAPILLSLGKNYWYLIPASLLSGLPALPFGGRNIELSELCITLCFGIFITRVAFKLDKFVFWRATHIPIYFFMAWVLFIFCLYPSGLAVFGSATMGGRFYLKLLLAFMAFLVISSREITEKDCKWIIGFLAGGAVVNCGFNIFSFFFFGPKDDLLSVTPDGDGFYTWHQSLSGPAMVFSFLIFAWKKPSVILQFKKPSLSFLYLLSILFALYSGKRIGLASVFLAPMLGAIVHRQYFYLWLGGVGATLMSVIIIFGHGEYFRLPIQMQRALSLLPAEWDSELRHIERGADPFRESLRRFALENIERNPIIGRGFTIEYSEIIGQIMATKYVGGGDSEAAPYAVGRSWHNRWLGYAADFGIPLSIIQGMLFIVVISVCYKSQSNNNLEPLKKIIILYILFFTIKDVLASHTSGHTAHDAFDRWWMYAVAFSIYASFSIKQIKKKLSPIESTFMQRVLDKKFHEA